MPKSNNSLTTQSSFKFDGFYLFLGMQNVHERLIKIKESTSELVGTVNELRQENAHLRREIAQLKEQIKPETSSEIKVDRDLIDEEWKVKIRHEVDVCIEEIDHCISLFNT